jgi:hypothetical protein
MNVANTPRLITHISIIVTKPAFKAKNGPFNFLRYHQKSRFMIINNINTTIDTNIRIISLKSIANAAVNKNNEDRGMLAYIFIGRR